MNADTIFQKIEENRKEIIESYKNSIRANMRNAAKYTGCVAIDSSYKFINSKEDFDEFFHEVKTDIESLSTDTYKISIHLKTFNSGNEYFEWTITPVKINSS